MRTLQLIHLGQEPVFTSHIWNEPMRTLQLIQMSQWEFCSWYTWGKNRFVTNHILNEPMRTLQLIHLEREPVSHIPHLNWTNENSATDSNEPMRTLHSTADTPGARTGFSHPKFEMNQWELCIWFKWANENSAADTPGTKTGFLQITFLNEPMRTLQLILLIQVQM